MIVLQPYRLLKADRIIDAAIAAGLFPPYLDIRRSQLSVSDPIHADMLRIVRSLKNQQ